LSVPAAPIVLPYTIAPCEPTAAFPRQQTVARPLVQTVLEYGGQRLPFFFHSVIDSGADYCVFPAQFGEKIGVPVREGKLQATKGVVGDAEAFFHFIKVFVGFDQKVYHFNCYAGFMYSLDKLGVGLLV